MKTAGLIASALLTMLLLSCGAPADQAEPIEIPAVSSTASLTPPPTLTPTVTRTPPSSGITRPPTPTPTVPVAVPIPKSEASILVYQPYGNIQAASSEGEWNITVIPSSHRTASHSSSLLPQAMAPTNGSIAYVTGPSADSGYTIWIYQPNSIPRVLLTLDGSPTHVDSVAISPDGSQIAYSLLYWPSSIDDWNEQLWVIDSDGSNNRLIADQSGDSIIEPGGFRLAPVAWSEDMSSVYLITRADNESIPTGLYEADVATGEIRKANTPQETLWRAMFSEDRSKILYSSFQWVSADQGFPERGLPFAIKVTDLASGDTSIIWESDEEFVSDPVWALDETAIAFSLARNKLVTIDLNTGELKIVVEENPDEGLQPGAEDGPEHSVQPRARQSDGRIVYTSGRLYSDLRLMTVRTDGSEPIFIDTVEKVNVFGELPSLSSTP